MINWTVREFRWVLCSRDGDPKQRQKKLSVSLDVTLRQSQSCLPQLLQQVTLAYCLAGFLFGSHYLICFFFFFISRALNPKLHVPLFLSNPLAFNGFMLSKLQ